MEHIHMLSRVQWSCTMRLKSDCYFQDLRLTTWPDWMVFGLDRPISVICSATGSDLTTSQTRPLQLINVSNMAASRLPSSHTRTRVRARQSLEERISRKATTSERSKTAAINGVDSDLEKLLISSRQRNFKLDDFEILNTLGRWWKGPGWVGVVKWGVLISSQSKYGA